MAEVSLFKEFRCHKLASELEAVSIQALRAIHHDSIEEKIGELLFGINASHGIPPAPPSIRGPSDGESILLLREPSPRAGSAADKIDYFEGWNSERF